MKRLMIAAPASGTGKTSITLGLMRALRNRGLVVQPYKAGPDYIDPAFHTQAAGRISRNLDLWLLKPETVRGLFAKNAAGADLCLMEGVMGLYDGLGHSLDNGSSAHLARVLELPVVLVVDGRGVSTSAAALVLGFRQLDSRVRLAGVIVNQVSGEKQYQLIREAVESLAGVPCFGYVKADAALRLESRHLGLVPSVETGRLEEKLEQLAEAVRHTVDLAGLERLAAEAGPLAAEPLPALEPGPEVRIGLARDEAFNFYYQDNLDLLEALGVTWVPFSPVHDRALPPGLQGLYFGGGFPEVFAAQLGANGPLREAVRQAAAQGMPLFAECGGYMYLMESLQDFDGNRFPMAGVLPGASVMTQRLQRFGYVTAETAADSLFGPAGTCLKGHEFHRSLRTGPETAVPAYRVARGRNPAETWHCGANTGNVLAAYAHIHWYSNLKAAECFVAACRRHR